MLNTDSLRISRSAIAYLYQNAIELERKENLAFYDEITNEGLDYTEMHQLPRELVLLRKAQDRQAEIRVGIINVASGPSAQPTPAAFRLLVAEQGSTAPVRVFQEAADSVFEKFLGVWGGRLGPFSLAEVSFSGTVAAGDDGGGAGFFRNRVFRFGDGVQGHLGRDFEQFGLKLGSGVLVHMGGPDAPSQTLAGAQVDLAIETSPQDPRVLAFQLMVKWPVVRLSGMQLPKEARNALGGREFIAMNQEANDPNVYIDAVYKYLTEKVMAFLRAAGR